MPLRPDVLCQFPARVFVETGSYLGDGVQAALDAGFERVITIEAQRKSWSHVRDRFAGDLRVTAILGSSADLLTAAIDNLDERATFWLDAHWSGEGTGGMAPFRDSCVYSPALEELAAIAAHPIKGHTILIDDMRVFRDGVFVDLDEELITPVRLMETILDIDERYEFVRLDGAEADDVLVAHIP
jgi:hypothetical protein